MPEFRNRPEKHPVIGALGKALQKVDEFARAPGGYSNPPVQMISDFLDIPGIYKTAENINYGSPLTRGTGLARQMTDDTKAGLFGAMNLAPGVAALAKAAKPLAKAAAPYAARHAVNVAEKYGVSPTMNIVKPEGNLNFRHSVIAESLKGPEKQKVSDFVKQVKGMQGLTKEGKKAAMVELEAMDPNTVVTKQFIEDSFTPSRYNKIDLGGAAEDASTHMELEATERALDDPERWHTVAAHLDLDYEDPNIAGQLERLYYKIEQDTRERRVMLDPERYIKNLSPEVIEAMERSGFIDQGVFQVKRFKNTVDEVTTDLSDTYLEMMQENHVPSEGYQYKEYQRLTGEDYAGYPEGDYVEMGISHPDAPGAYSHYPNSSEPMVAHFRGTGNSSEAMMPFDNAPRLELDDNSFVIEELQADAQKGIKQEGPLHQAHATAFKAAVQHALEQGHNTVYLPTAETIGYARDKPAASFAPIYDQEVVNYGLAPLSRVPGVTVSPIDAEGVTAYHKLNFSPEAIEELLSGKGQTFPGFAVGGAVGMKEGGKPERTEDRQSFRATPRSGALGKIADATKYLHENYLKAQGGYSNPVTDAISNLAGVPAFADMMDRLSYGDSMFKGKGETLKLQDWAVDGLSSVPAGVATNLGIKVIKSIPGALKHGATSFAKASAGNVSNVVRPKGSQNVDMQLNRDIDSSLIERSAPDVTRARLAEFENMLAQAPTYEGAEELPNLISRIKNDLAVDDWVRGTLAKYVKRDMATPEDPLRKLAEEGIVHTQFNDAYATASPWIKHERNSSGYPVEGMGVSPDAKKWEVMADQAVSEPHMAGSYYADPFELNNLPTPDWYKNLPEGTKVYEPRLQSLGMDHIVDVLHSELAAGRLRPEQMSKISMEDAVRRTHAWDMEMAAKMDAAKAARREGLPVHKEYGDGFRWVELNKPGSFAAESDAMGHSVRGYEPPKGHADWVEDSAGHGYSTYGHGGWDAIKSGKAKVHSLVDEKGHPHVTVESFTPEIKTWDDVTRLIGRDKAKQLWDEFGSTYRTTTPDKSTGSDPTSEAINEFLVSKGIDSNANRVITQIKGKQNARPADDYQAYVADFVRTGDFHPVIGDAHHTDLIEVGGKNLLPSEIYGLFPEGYQVQSSLGPTAASSLSPAQLKQHIKVLERGITEHTDTDKAVLDALRGFTPPEMKEGGSVNDLRSHYLGTPMTKVRAESMSPDLLDILEEWGAKQDLKTQTQEQIVNLSPLDYETFRLAHRLDKHDRYKTGKFPSGQDNAINSPSPFEQPIEDMPGDFKFNHVETDIGNQIRDNPYKPNDMDSMTSDWDPQGLRRQEKIKQRYYADGGTVNLRAHYLGN